MKIADIVAQKLVALGVEKPSMRLVEEVEKLVLPKVLEVVESKVSPRLAAKAFAATLGMRQVNEGASGDAPERVP